MSYLRRNGIALVALFVALGGTGLAAGRYLITNAHRQISPGALRELRGMGARGPEGKEGKEGVQKVTVVSGATGPEGRPGAYVVETKTIPVQGIPGHSAYFTGETVGGFSVCIEGEGCRFVHNGSTGPTGPTGP